MDEKKYEKFQSLKGKELYTILNMLIEDYLKLFTLISRKISVKAIVSSALKICPLRNDLSVELVIVCNDPTTWFGSLFHFSYTLSSVFLLQVSQHLLICSLCEFVGKNLQPFHKPKVMYAKPGSLPLSTVDQSPCFSSSLGH